MLNMLPKFALVAMNTYLSVLANVMRPSRTPSASTLRSGASSTMSAASLATSTAVLTEMPTSAECRAEASLIPSPKNPTTCPARLRARTIRSFWWGSTSAKTSDAAARTCSAASVMVRMSRPVRTRGSAIPTSVATAALGSRRGPRRVAVR